MPKEDHEELTKIGDERNAGENETWFEYLTEEERRRAEPEG